MALEDLEDIKEGVAESLVEVGCNIIIREITQDQSTYDPYNPTSNETITDTPTLGKIKNFASEDLATSMPKELINNYQMSITLQTDIKLDTSMFIVFDNKEYEILFVYPFVMLNEIYKYEVLVG